MPAQFDLFEGKSRRDEGIDLVGGNNPDWLACAIRIVMRNLPPGDFLAETFRAFPGIGKPNHVNAWGALTRELLRLNIIEPTGRIAPSSSVRNHAHEYKIYRAARRRI